MDFFFSKISPFVPRNKKSHVPTEVTLNSKVRKHNILLIFFYFFKGKLSFNWGNQTDFHLFYRQKRHEKAKKGLN